jgi:hypothetical protein
MEYVTSLFNRLFNIFKDEGNLELTGTYHHQPRTIIPNARAISAHQVTCHKAFTKFLTDHEITHIEHDLRRSEMTEEAILADFFANDVENHQIPFDHHVEKGLTAMANAFRPPQKCMPAHINDVEHHYPYKWQVNAEPPFSTDDYFLNNRKPFSDFYDRITKLWTGYVNPADALRRYGPDPTPGQLETVTPAKFGFMKEAIFSWTRRWHHIIKSGFTDLTGLESSTYLKDRFIFPMLLHTKTAIVKKDDPNKMRTIWGYPKPAVIAETQFYWELIAWIKLNPGLTPMLWGFETFTGGWIRLNALLFNSLIRQSFITIDWSRFDKRAYFSLIRRIMLNVRTFLDFDHGYLPNVNYPDTAKDWTPEKARKLENLWTWTLECLFNAPIVLPDGRMYRRRYAGIPSGLFITQLLDSWYNYTMLATILSALGIDPEACIIKVQGDDSIIRLAVLIPPHAHEEFLLKMQEMADFYFKSVISTAKSEIGNTLNGREVLSYRNNNGQPYRDEIAMLAQLFHTKAKNPTPEITMAQAIGFAYAACGNHQRVHLALQDIYDYYYQNGYRPNPAGLALTFGDSPDRPNFPFMLDHFPSISETKQYLLYTTYANEAQNAKTWPMNYFLYRPCERT